MKLLLSVSLLLNAGFLVFAGFFAATEVHRKQLAQAQQEVERASNNPLAKVFVAARSLGYGKELTPEDVVAVRWPKDALPEGVFTSLADLFPDEQGMNRSVLAAFVQGEPILSAKLSDPGEPAGLAFALSDGMRAFSIRADVAAGLYGFLRAGDKVDVYWTGEHETKTLTRLIVTNALVISIDDVNLDDAITSGVSHTVTLAVQTTDVVSLSQAQATGQLSLSLVAAGDDTETEDISIGQRDLLGIEEEVGGAEHTCFVRRRRGTEIITIEIPCHRHEGDGPLGAGDWPGPRLE